MAEIISIERATSPVGDIIFVHGLGGDPKETWGFSGDRSWRRWIRTNRPDLNIWSIQYRVEPTEWTGGAMPLSARALNILALLDNRGIGHRPIVFIGHSMGGLLIKEMLRHSLTVTARFKYVTENTKAVVFFATPNSGATLADLALYFKFVLRASVAISEITSQQSRLIDLNLWYRNNYAALGLKSCVFYETRSTNGLRVVNETSADPGIPQVSPIAIDSNHISITKPHSYRGLVVGQTLKTIDEAIPSDIYRYDPERENEDDVESGCDDLPPPPPPKWRLFRIALIATSTAIVAVAIYKFIIAPRSPSFAIDSETYISHWIGYPQLVMRFTIENPTSVTTQFMVNSLKLVAPNSGRQILMNLEGILNCNGSVPTNILIYIEAKHTTTCVYSFLSMTNLGALTPKLEQVLIQKGGAATGPRRNIIEEPLLGELRQVANKNFQWVPGIWEIRLSYSLSNENIDQRFQFTVESSHIEQMKAIFQDYDAGYGVYSFWRGWTVDGSQPMPQVDVKPVAK